MTSENNQNQPVTQGEFREAMQSVDRRFSAIDRRFDASDTRFNKLVHKVLDIETELKSVKANMATKSDIRLILNRMDEFLNRTEGHERTALIQREQLKDHEGRITRLESSKN